MRVVTAAIILRRSDRELGAASVPPGTRRSDPRRRLPPVTPWTTAMALVRSWTGGATPAAEARAALVAFNATGRRPTYGWLPFGLEHETGRPETWGPRSPEAIDWQGFGC
jgi:hypothetical protein